MWLVLIISVWCCVDAAPSQLHGMASVYNSKKLTQPDSLRNFNPSYMYNREQDILQPHLYLQDRSGAIIEEIPSAGPEIHPASDVIGRNHFIRNPHVPDSIAALNTAVEPVDLNAIPVVSMPSALLPAIGYEENFFFQQPILYEHSYKPSHLSQLENSPGLVPLLEKIKQTKIEFMPSEVVAYDTNVPIPAAIAQLPAATAPPTRNEELPAAIAPLTHGEQLLAAVEPPPTRIQTLPADVAPPTRIQALPAAIAPPTRTEPVPAAIAPPTPGELLPANIAEPTRIQELPAAIAPPTRNEALPAAIVPLTQGELPAAIAAPTHIQELPATFAPPTQSQQLPAAVAPPIRNEALPAAIAPLTQGERLPAAIAPLTQSEQLPAAIAPPTEGELPAAIALISQLNGNSPIAIVPNLQSSGTTHITASGSTGSAIISNLQSAEFATTSQPVSAAGAPVLTSNSNSINSAEAVGGSQPVSVAAAPASTSNSNNINSAEVVEGPQQSGVNSNPIAPTSTSQSSNTNSVEVTSGSASTAPSGNVNSAEVVAAQQGSNAQANQLSAENAGGSSPNSAEGLLVKSGLHSSMEELSGEMEYDGEFRFQDPHSKYKSKMSERDVVDDKFQGIFRHSIRASQRTGNDNKLSIPISLGFISNLQTTNANSAEAISGSNKNNNNKSSSESVSISQSSKMNSNEVTSNSSSASQTSSVQSAEVTAGPQTSDAHHNQSSAETTGTRTNSAETNVSRSQTITDPKDSRVDLGGKAADKEVTSILKKAQYFVPDFSLQKQEFPSSLKVLNLFDSADESQELTYNKNYWAALKIDNTQDIPDDGDTVTEKMIDEESDTEMNDEENTEKINVNTTENLKLEYNNTSSALDSDSLTNIMNDFLTAWNKEVARQGLYLLRIRNVYPETGYVYMPDIEYYTRLIQSSPSVTQASERLTSAWHNAKTKLSASHADGLTEASPEYISNIENILGLRDAQTALHGQSAQPFPVVAPSINPFHPFHPNQPVYFATTYPGYVSGPYQIFSLAGALGAPYPGYFPPSQQSLTSTVFQNAPPNKDNEINVGSKPPGKVDVNAKPQRPKGPEAAKTSVVDFEESEQERIEPVTDGNFIPENLTRPTKPDTGLEDEEVHPVPHHRPAFDTASDA